MILKPDVSRSSVLDAIIVIGAAVGSPAVVAVRGRWWRDRIVGSAGAPTPSEITKPGKARHFCGAAADCVTKRPRGGSQIVRPQTTWAGGGFTGGGGGSFGGGGATSTEAWGSPKPKRRPPPSHTSAPTIVSSNRAVATNTVSARTANAPSEVLRTIVRNGYTYQIDARERTRRVSGMLTVAPEPVRSRTSQRLAGGAERRASDDGGHYIAARFNGPTEAFNHFASDANFNRGGYRLLEDEWARNKRAGRTVTVKIVPQFGSASVRPSTINVWWTVDGKENSLQFPNERSEKSRGGNWIGAVAERDWRIADGR